MQSRFTQLLAAACGIVLAGGPVAAECLGDGCYAGLGGAIGSVLAYGVIAIIVLIQLFRRKLRSVAAILGVTAVVAVGVPALSSANGAWQARKMAGFEVMTNDLSLSGDVVVHLHMSSSCRDNVCEAVARYSDAAFLAGVIYDPALPIDLSGPVDLATLEYEVGSLDEGGYRAHPWVRDEAVSLDDIRTRMAQATRFVITQQFYYARQPGDVEQALWQNPAFQGIADDVTLAMVVGRLAEPGILDLSRAEFQFVDLTTQTQVLDMPLILGSLRSMPFYPTPQQREGLAPSFCVGADDWSCGEMLGRQWYE